MLDVYELCTSELQEKMVGMRSKFKEMRTRSWESSKKMRKIRWRQH
uniref:Uncharacterized protein n=1 Tax=Anguilla anguilla TaxID=7936 RepID=A0A0E9UMQ1_ANGAN